jgi:hypothetical protein
VSDNSTFTSDDTRVGIESKTFGRFSVGQFDSFMEDNVMEVLGSFIHGENAVMTEAAASNDGRHAQYLYKSGGLSFAVDYTSALGPTTNPENSNGYALTLMYQTGGLTVAAGLSELAKYKADSSGTQGALNTDKSANGLAITYKIDNFAVKGLFAQVESTANIKTDISGLGVTYVMGPVDFGLSMQKVRPENKDGRDEWVFGVGYTPFKAFQVYANAAGLNKANGEGDAVELGMKYTF